MSEIFNLATEKYNLRCKHRLTIPKVQSVKHGYQTVPFRAAIIWNNLPNKYKEKKTLSSFKSAIKQWPVQNCHCRILPLSILFYFLYVFIILWSM